MSDLKQQALDYHEFPRPGKVSVEPIKSCVSAADLSLAYTPGVAHPVMEIHRDPQNAYRYTNKGNLVAVITDGTAVLGLGNVGALAGKPVMEGKAMLFKKFADIDVFDIEVKAPSVESFIETVVNISPTFGGINLEDIAAPQCFEIEEALKKRLDIPVFHDDQHGTAVVTCAGLLNALEIQGKKLETAKIVCLGAGAAGIASIHLLMAMGLSKKNIIMVDSKGVIHDERTELTSTKKYFAIKTDKRSLTDAMQDADVFLGVSGPNLITADMVKLMAPHPVIFALANPIPEILPEVALAARDDLLMATGRSDYPNQVNNSLCFPFLFRGALDAKAKRITQPMLVAAVKAIAELARESVPAAVLKAYNLSALKFGKDYILPKQFDPRLNDYISPKVKEAALKDEAWK